MRLLIWLGLGSILAFIFWFFSEDRQGYAPLFWILIIMWFFKMIRTLHEWYHYYNISVPKAPVLTSNFTVDILTTACPGEPREMIIETLHAMQAIRYPHTSYLCDEGNDPELKNVCDALGIIHVTRTEKINAKAGNINNALRQATGDICIILDPDHVPIPEFIDRVLPYFENPEIGFVQSVQAYKNRKESLVALGACEQTYHFYGPIMMSMNHYGTAQAIGANCAFRRKALDSIGGHAPGLAEDMHTSMLLHAQGWKSVYIPEVLTRGLVPSTLSAYYKQQLKWSRGTFDIFFKTLPKIFNKLSLAQKFHYATIPLYFFYGIIDFLNIVIPVVSLTLAEFPWQIDIIKFMRMSLPIIIMTILIRQYAQKWLLENHERGFHFVGGLLRIGTWWVYSLGFIYTLFNIKVPYIPTPKEGQAENAWKLCIPNIIACLVAFVAIGYGLYLDSSPFTFFMALLAFTNIIILGYVVIISQQKTLFSIYNYINSQSFLKDKIFQTRLTWWHLRHGIYSSLRKHSFYAGCLTMFFILTFLYQEKKELSYDYISPHLNQGNFYANAENKKQTKNTSEIDFVRMEGYTIHLSDTSIQRIAGIYKQIANNHNLMINIYIDSMLVKAPKQLVTGIRAKNHAPTIAFLAEEVRKIEKPVYINLSNHSELGSWASRKIILYLKKQFEYYGVSNAVWVTDQLVKSTTDWVYISIDSSEAKNQLQKLIKLEKDSAFTYPIVVDFHSNFNQPATLAILKKYNKIRGIVESSMPYPNVSLASLPQNNRYSEATQKSFEFKVDNKHFVIKGVSYNEPGFLYEENLPLTRSQLRRDFSRIEAMGANTIRSYHPSLYDRNLFSTANEYNLKILYGFWFEPHINYMSDTAKLKEYMNLVEINVENYKKNKALIGWSLGNETWSAIQYLFKKPELIEVRIAYMKFLENIIRKIKLSDPAHPVFVMIPYNKDFTAAVRDFSKYVPSADIVGVNVYNKDQMSRIASIMAKHNPNRPYLISEFSAADSKNKIVLDSTNFAMYENSDHDKAKAYYWNWIKNVHARQEQCVGGVAYTWHDKKEITATWFGITDYKGRLKPVYYALQKAWKDRNTRQAMPWAKIEVKNYDQNASTCSFTCKLEYNREYKYEWFLQIENLNGFTGSMTEVGSSPELNLKLPKDRKAIRLYVFVSDTKGNVVTSSLPLNAIK